MRHPPTAKVIPQNLAVDLADSRNRRQREAMDSDQSGVVRVAVLVGQPPAQTQTQLVELVEQQDRP